MLDRWILETFRFQEKPITQVLLKGEVLWSSMNIEEFSRFPCIDDIGAMVVGGGPSV